MLNRSSFMLFLATRPTLGLISSSFKTSSLDLFTIHSTLWYLNLLLGMVGSGDFFLYLKLQTTVKPSLGFHIIPKLIMVSEITKICLNIKSLKNLKFISYDRSNGSFKINITSERQSCTSCYSFSVFS